LVDQFIRLFVLTWRLSNRVIRTWVYLWIPSWYPGVFRSQK